MTPSSSLSRVARLVLVAIGMILLVFHCSAQIYPYNHASFGTGGGADGVVASDFNHDGKVDLAVTNHYDNTLSVLLGAPGGAFAGKVNYAIGSSPTLLITADFRGNGRSDLAVINEYDSSRPGSVSILLGNGDGTFRNEVEYLVGNYPVGLVAGDFNGDGKLDLAVANDYDSTVSILMGNGDGTFQPQVAIPVGNEPNSLGLGDFNGDKKIDLITSNGSGTVSILLSKGDGTFSRVDSPNGLVGRDFSWLAVADFNQDHNLDVVVSSISGPLMLLSGNGDGSFQVPTAIPDSVPNGIHFLFAADFNHDGKPDVAEEGVGGLLYVFLGVGNGTFRKPVTSPTTPAGTLTSFTLWDINGDGRLDLIAADANNNSVDVLLGNGNGSFARPVSATLPQTGDLVDAAVSADFNGDGKMDVAVAESGFPHGQVAVRLGQGNGTFGKTVVSRLVGSAINNDDLMFAADFNGDDKIDLLVMDDYSTGFSILIGNGDGSFQPAVDTPLGFTILSLAVGDFNGDGRADVVVTTNGNSGNASMNVYLSNGDGTFRAGSQFVVPLYAAISVADVNHDGKTDLVLSGFASPLEVYLGKGNGSFQSPISGPTTTYNGRLNFGDFNRDGKLDIAVGTYSGMAFLAGDGNGSFQSLVYSNPTIQYCCEVGMADVTGDGILDLVNGATTGGDGLTVIAGNGDGTFRPPVALGTGVTTGTLVITDLNSDGVADLAIATQDAYTGREEISSYLSGPAAVAFPTAVTFAPETVGKTSAPQTITLSNAGNSPLTISGIALTGEFLEKSNCGLRVLAGKSCTIQVSFKPTAKGIHAGTLEIKDNFLGSPQVFHLSGIGK
jgi:FG-GAP-like repeat